MINKNVFRTYDIRGIAESPDLKEIDFTEENIYELGRAIATFLINNRNSKSIAVGADCRTSSPKLKAALIKGLLECGLNVVDIGLCTSPMTYWTTCTQNLDAGITVTASHNPKEYNGFKICAKNAEAIFGNDILRIYEIIDREDFIKNTTPGTLTQKEIWPQYLTDLKSKISLSRPLKVVIDSGNGITGLFAPDLMHEIGCETIELFTTPDGTFPNHEANPEKEENLRVLMDTVLKEKADLGIAFDGDGDRLGIVDEKGHKYSADIVLTILAKDLCSRVVKPQIIVDTKCSQAVINELTRLGATPIIYKTGHSLIKKKMREISAPLAGEVSGHLYFGENWYGFDDAFLGAIKILEILSKSDKPFSSLFDKIEKTYATEEIKAHCPDDLKFRLVEKITRHFSQHYNCETIDGVRVKFGTLEWALIRCSNTSPYLTLRFEATTKEQLKEIQKTVFEELKKYPQIDNSWYTKS